MSHSRKKILNDLHKRKYFTGCILGGAVGDALGWPVEFESLMAIRQKYGHGGINDLLPSEDGYFEITDDTQMSLFTAEGLLRGWTDTQLSGAEPNFASALRCSYLSWLKTQDGLTGITEAKNGWLIHIEGLHKRREPGDTCLSALRNLSCSDHDFATNSSKGSGGVMRAAPAGLLAVKISNGDRATVAQLAFNIGCTAAKLTHGHPSGYYPAGVLAAVIASILTGECIEEAIYTSLDILQDYECSGETFDAIKSAVTLWQDKSVIPSPEAIESLGSGWVGEEALAIGLYCALTAKHDFVRGVKLAVNHSGDSDSTGSITGNILGAMLGEQAIPHDWLKQLELVDVIRQVGNDLFTTFENSESWLKCYPLVNG